MITAKRLLNDYIRKEEFEAQQRQKAEIEINKTRVLAEQGMGIKDVEELLKQVKAGSKIEYPPLVFYDETELDFYYNVQEEAVRYLEKNGYKVITTFREYVVHSIENAFWEIHDKEKDVCTNVQQYHTYIIWNTESESQKLFFKSLVKTIKESCYEGSEDKITLIRGEL